MAKLLYGKVYYKGTFAGFIRQEPGFGSSFCYDSQYLQSDMPPISYTLPLKQEPEIYQTDLPPFFDNLVAEGWLEQTQSRLLGSRIADRFALLLAFGHDCAGAVSIVDPMTEKLSTSMIDMNDPMETAVLHSRASLSGVQPKLAVVSRDGKYFPATNSELSTHIAKFYSKSHHDLVINEYLTTLAFKKLLPDEDVVNLEISMIEGFKESALLIERFDRKNEQRIHFEEFNQLFNQPANCKYIGSYEQMADFISNTESCMPTEAYQLYLRILGGILLGNTDMHLKNFAMIHTAEGLRLSPVYDQVCATLYGYKHLALSIGNKKDLNINQITPDDLHLLGQLFKLNNKTIKMAISQIKNNLEGAKNAIDNTTHGNQNIKQKIIETMERIWKQAFDSTGQS